MDASEDNKDSKLYRASPDLLAEISRRLDELIPSGKKATSHQSWVVDSEIQKLIGLVSNSPAESSWSCADRSTSARPIPGMASVT